jgi:RNA polymerase sigma-70 factor (ECF subfamily)
MVSIYDKCTTNGAERTTRWERGRKNEAGANTMALPGTTLNGNREGAMTVDNGPTHDDRTECLGDRDSREEFVRAAYAGLFGWFCRLVGSPDRAADLTQETFAAFWISVHRIRGDVSPRTWLYAIGRNLWRKQERATRRYEPDGVEGLADDALSAERRAEEREFRDAAERAVRELPDDLREVFTLRFWHEFDYDEIGAIQGVSAGLARWRFFAARRRLHEKLAAWDPRRDHAEEDKHAR